MGRGMTSETTNGFWAIVEVMGHQRFAGWLSEITLAGAGFLRIDCPELPLIPAVGRYGRERPMRPAFSKIISTGSVFSVTPCTEETARMVDENDRPVSVLNLPTPARLNAPATDEDSDDEVESGVVDDGWEGVEPIKPPDLLSPDDYDSPAPEPASTPITFGENPEDFF